MPSLCIANEFAIAEPRNTHTICCMYVYIIYHNGVHTDTHIVHIYRCVYLMHIEICLSSRVLGLSSISSTVAAFAADGGNLYWFYRLSCPWPSLFDTRPGLPLVLCILSVRQFMSFVCHFWRSLSLANTHQTHAHTHTHLSTVTHSSKGCSSLGRLVGYSCCFSRFSMPLCSFFSHSCSPSVLTVIACQGAVEFYDPDSCFFLC